MQTWMILMYACDIYGALLDRKKQTTLFEGATVRPDD